jgi:hypothetical protein
MDETKPKVGRPISVNVKENPEYFNAFYHSHNKLVKCECGLPVMSMGLNKHIKTNKHKKFMENRFLKDKNL